MPSLDPLPEATSPEERQRWERLRTTGDPKVRAGIVEQYLPFVRGMALRMYRDVPKPTTLEPMDFVQYGTVGLLESVDRYDHAQGVGFLSFASKRIRGAILTGSAKSTEQNAQAAAVKRRERERLQSVKEGSAEASLGSALEELVEIAVGLALGLLLEDTKMFVDESSTVQKHYQSEELRLVREQIRYVVEGLPEQQRSVVRHHYYHDLPFSEIAKLLDVSAARISQIHSRAMREIRSRLHQLGEFTRDY